MLFVSCFEISADRPDICNRSERDGFFTKEHTEYTEKYFFILRASNARKPNLCDFCVLCGESQRFQIL